MTYILKTPRATAAAYLFWEFGVARANQIMSALPGAQVDLNNPICNSGLVVWSARRQRYGLDTKKAAERARAKIIAIAMFEFGRLGKTASAECHLAEGR